MFILSETNENSLKALSKLREFLSSSGELTCGEIHSHPISNFWLHWFNCKPSDNLHIFKNGVIIGKLDFAEDSSNSPILHDEQLPSNLHPLLNAVTVETNNNRITITPNHTTNVFISSKNASNMQLLLADLEDVAPDSIRVGVLATVGYLPGDITLFRTIQKIPFLHQYSMTEQKFQQATDIESLQNNDEEMVRRLIDIVPSVPSYLGISGGYDSRFVLGCLLKAGVKPHLIHLDGNEKEIVSQLASELDLSLSIKESDSNGSAALSGQLYSIMTDGQIYFRGGGYSKARSFFRSKKPIFHTGLFADSIIKNAFKTAWKVPSRTNISHRLVKYALLSTSPSILSSLRDGISKDRLLAFLIKNTNSPIKLNLKSNKQHANWFYFLHRGIRWTYATTADLSYYMYPVFLLSDLKSQLNGLSSSAWSNFQKDRVRKLNYDLLPKLQTPYDDGGFAKPSSSISRSVSKVKYEYFDRLLTRVKAQKDFRNKTNTAAQLMETIPESSNTTFSKYFSGSLQQLIDRNDIT